MEEETFPDISPMSNQEVHELIERLTAEEQEVRLSEILAGRSEPPTGPPT